MNVTAITVEEILTIIERLHPNSLLLLRQDSGLDEGMMKELWTKVVSSFDPRRRLENIEYLLLVMHEGRVKDPRRYLHEVFLPWMGIKRRLFTQVMRVIDDIARIKHLDAYTDEDVAHTATKIYRPLVADIFDPYMTLLVATYKFLDGTFTSIHDANVGLGERGKAELVTARLKRFGGPSDFLEGYDPIVRNALSHAGSEGVLYEPGAILFKDIKRGLPAVVQTRRWTHDELHFHVLGLMELIMSIDAAVDVFGVDCMDMLSDRASSLKILFYAFGRDQRMEFMRGTQEKLDQIRTADKPMSERLDSLAKILFNECAERDIPCDSVGFSEEHKLLNVKVPVDRLAVTDTEIRDQALILIRYAILARAVFGTLFMRFRVDGTAVAGHSTSVELLGSALDGYSAETLGLIDLLSDADIHIGDGTAKIAVDEAALSIAEDARLGPRFPRRGRPVSD